MAVEICAGLCIGWVVLYEVLKRTVFPNILQRQEKILSKSEYFTATRI